MELVQVALGYVDEPQETECGRMDSAASSIAINRITKWITGDQLK